jgi:hypothetical protein
MTPRLYVVTATATGCNRRPPHRYALRQAREKLCGDGLTGLCHAVFTTLLFVQSLDNVTDPDRQKLPHSTEPGSRGRQLENGFHRFRGAAQLVPQGLTVLASRADNAAVVVVHLLLTSCSKKYVFWHRGARSSRAEESESNELNDLERGPESP